MKLYSIPVITLLSFSSVVEGIRSTTRRRTKAKGSKHDKEKGSRSRTLYSLLESSTGLETIITVNFNPDDSALVHIAGTTGISGCSTPEDGAGGACTVTLQESCEGMNLYHSGLSDPWSGEVNYFTTDNETTETKSAFVINYGLGYSESNGAVVVVRTPSEDSWCGHLQPAPRKLNALQASVGTYPVYSGSKDLTPTGTIGLEYGVDGTFTYSYNVAGLEANCEGCGIHVHAGVSCESHEAVKGHGWNIEYVRDLWTAAGGSVYTTDAHGNATGEFKLYNGFDIFSNMNHAVVIHAQDGARLGCGVLKLVV